MYGPIEIGDEKEKGITLPEMRVLVHHCQINCHGELITPTKKEKIVTGKNIRKIEVPVLIAGGWMAGSSLYRYFAESDTKTRFDKFRSGFFLEKYCRRKGLCLVFLEIAGYCPA